MRWQSLCILFILATIQLGTSQQLHLQFKLIDQATQNPICDAHVFVNNSSIGTISNDEGLCTFSLATQETQHIIISHLSYETIIIDSDSFPTLVAGAIVNMKRKGIDLSQVQVTAERGGKWKANLKKFRLALLGDGSAASKCKILNPEVLRFEERDGKFTATAIDLLHIDNNYLGYDLKFKLEELSIAANGSKYYKGNAQFSEKENVNDRKIKKRRENNYENSLAHFLRSLIISPDQATLESHGYQLSLEKYDSGIFTQLATIGPQDVMRPTEIPGIYHLYFSEFLTIKHLALPLTTTETKVPSLVQNNKNLVVTDHRQLQAKKNM